jgi:hypothetical protein
MHESVHANKRRQNLLNTERHELVKNEHFGLCYFTNTFLRGCPFLKSSMAAKLSYIGQIQGQFLQTWLLHVCCRRLLSDCGNSHKIIHFAFIWHPRCGFELYAVHIAHLIARRSESQQSKPYCLCYFTNTFLRKCPFLKHSNFFSRPPGFQEGRRGVLLVFIDSTVEVDRQHQTESSSYSHFH